MIVMWQMNHTHMYNTHFFYNAKRWWRDGTQVIVNQACEHSDKPGTMKESEGDACRGYALRGANCE